MFACYGANNRRERTDLTVQQDNLYRRSSVPPSKFERSHLWLGAFRALPEELDFFSVNHVLMHVTNMIGELPCLSAFAMA